MQIYKWTDALKTNNAKIDQDHRKIIDKAQELSQAMSDGKGQEHVVEITNFLLDYVKKHFAEEEAMQMKSNYHGYEIHKKNHTYFVSELHLLADKIRQNPTSAVNVLELNKLISGWFFSHIQKLDMEVAKHINNSDT